MESSAAGAGKALWLMQILHTPVTLPTGQHSIILVSVGR